MFIDVLVERIEKVGTPLCVGLDPSLALMPSSFLDRFGITPDTADLAAGAEALFHYNLQVLDAVADRVVVVKPQSAYFELFGAHGMRALERSIAAARDRGLLVILDAKRGDIGSTSEAYARAYLAKSPPRELEVDALTLSPYLGDDSLSPFFAEAKRWGKGVFVCARTSNPGGAMLQDLQVDGRFVYEIVADLVHEQGRAAMGASGYSNFGIVVGATVEEQARRLRARMPGMYFLVPGLGAQGGALSTLAACFDDRRLGALISVSRAVMYPHLHGSAGTALVDAIRAALAGFSEQVRGAVRGVV
jgi:orotidine-5'-phosphate decarboxylase